MRRSLALLLALLAGAAVMASADNGITTTADRRAIISSSPQYPTKARNERIEGDVTVCYTIDARGKVRRPYVQTSSHRIFNREALRAAKKMVYEPAAPGAANDRAPACSTFRFRLPPAGPNAQL